MTDKTPLTPQLLLTAYSMGVFPMAQDDGRILWYDPNPRAVIPIEGFHRPRRLMRTLRNAGFELRVDTCFRRVMEECAAPRADHEGTWISEELVDAYVDLHRQGYAHSVETWQGGELVGGLYGVALRGLFAGESMFSRARDASKVALVHLIDRLQQGGFVLLDTQFLTSHLARFGAATIPREEYKARLAEAMRVEARF